ncbi:alpha/beta fold hydrolase [Marinomonas aquiplantarum]|uniref:Pimeloyl-ACP methyl ester carboxylesterase n=1 Tax=Marinomonas aquiplantarum TaxID=491951 RepID=A0A366CVT7_9GAMM|nr:alpha/beta hydrolase [Marinomonas aquiplantarum]RBO81933.1 pimeloyl-ACP methyl ester carboxylesterase [Marinomonas aquiplantarum]
MSLLKIGVIGSVLVALLTGCNPTKSTTMKISNDYLIDPQTEWEPVPEQVPAMEGYVEVDGAKLWYWDTGGEGESIVLLHPASSSALIWKYQQPFFANKGYRVISYSRRGHLNTEITDDTVKVSGMSDLLSVVDHLGVERFHLVGLAAGADIVPDVAVSHPERLLSITIGVTIGKIGDPNYRATDDTLFPEGYKAMPVLLKEVSPNYRESNPQGMKEWLAIEQISRLKRVAIPLENTLTPDQLAAVKVPVLLFTGDSDMYMPPSRLRSYAKYWTDPEVYIFREAGHAPYWEQPIAFNELLLNFFQQHGE